MADLLCTKHFPKVNSRAAVNCKACDRRRWRRKGAGLGAEVEIFTSERESGKFRAPQENGSLVRVQQGEPEKERQVERLVFSFSMKFAFGE